MWDSKARFLMRAYWAFAIVALLSLLGVALAHADEVGPVLPQSEDLGLTIFAGIAAILVSVIGWVGVHAAAWLKAHTKNQALGGVLARVTDSIFSSVKSALLASKAAIEDAKKASSPGGTAITSDELKGIKQIAWDSLKKEYGGMAGLSSFLSILGLGGDDGVSSWVDQRIEAAVHDTTKASAAPLS